ncbi:NAD-dependent succinate-semialdehyde dehydrogenase [Nocardia rhizosphaerihabitans]|uniref:NAD-dependent succinate-semialdehyde dehydrogenase n=1 Tax=Nocardia rhizosphaerihabitans TaxID=1691570 RepID=UPI00366E409B
MSTKPSTIRDVETAETRIYEGGQWRDAQGARTFQVFDPATEMPLASVADATPDDALAALNSAVAAQRDWARTAPRVRSEILRRAFDAVTARTEEFAALITLEMGKPLAEARAEVAYSAEFLRWFGEEAVRSTGRFGTAPDGRTRLLVGKFPVGPTLLITPWNFPLAMAARKIAPAIAAGCTMVLKPAALTPLTSLLLTRVLADAGLPPGVLNVIPTSSAAQTVSAIITDPRLRKVSFTGSTEVGRRLLGQSATHVLRTSMELGGNAPFLVFDDADIDAAVDGAIVAKLRNMGQACTAANRFLVHESVVEEFTDKLTDRMAALVVGPGIDPDTHIGPLIDEVSRRKVHDLVLDAVEHGAVVRTGGAPLPSPGHFYPPTVLADVDPGSCLLREEIFGPVAPIIRFETEPEAIAMANSTEYGLAAYAYTRDTARGLRLMEQLETGMLGLNVGVVSNPAAPFGGVKQSGLGREGGLEGIEEYLETRYTAVGDPYA